MGKMTVKRAARFLCVLAALLVQMLTVNATMYFHSDQQRDSSLYETAASVKTESSKTCLVSGVHEVCQSAQINESGETRYFHVCPTDGDPCNPQKCYYSSEPLCCPNTIGLNCIATSDLLVGGEITKVTFNRISLIGAICVVVSPAVNACDADCVLRCPPTDCVNNTVCDSDGSNCRCKEGYGSPGESHCCNCAVGNVTHPYYKTNGTCTVYCRSNCRVVFPPTSDNPNGGPCETCRREGFLPPTCCDCDTIGNDTHAFYKTPDGQCKPFCKQNCAVIGEQGCDECKVGYVDTPECCDCDTTGNATHAFYRTPTGECKPFCKSNCATIGANGCDECKVGYADTPECCDCDTTGNATHAFYRTSTGECKPFCKQNCGTIGERGCDSCKVGYVSEPECCDCDTIGNETHAFYRTLDGKCLPFCKQNCAVIGERGCDSCKVGYVNIPECCDCDTIGNETHAFYRTLDGKCLPFCKQNCAVIGERGCDSCKDGYVNVPECCDCDTIGNETHAFYRTVDGKCLPFCKQNCAVIGERGCGSCKVGYVSEPECCDCDTIGNETHAFYRTPDGKCLPFCKQNCAEIGERGCDSCKVGYVSEPKCCDCDTIGNVTHAFYRAPDGKCLPFCKQNCAVIGERGCDSCKVGYINVPECCDCDTIGNATHAFYRTTDGKCLPFCKQNCAVIGERGCDSCKDGYVSVPQCCDCDTIGNATHAFYRTTDGKCLPFCRPNCDGIGERGCEVCKDGFESKPDCCRSTKCDKDQDLYFLIDATASNNYLCQLVSVVQMLVAAFNPSSISDSGTKLLAWLFGSNIAEPSLVFDSSTSCDKIVNDRLVSLINESNTCRRKPDRTYTSPVFPSLCGQSTSAVSGLQKIATEVGKKGTSGNSAIVMLTDGVIRDNKGELKEVLQKLANTMIIAAGIQDADTNNLKNYTSSVDNILHSRNDPVDLGLQIVAHLNKTGVLCADHANNITTSIKTARENHLDFFCRCHSPVKNDKEPCSKWKLQYPTCGGDLKIGAFRIQTLELEEEILAAVESVLENHRG